MSEIYIYIELYSNCIKFVTKIHQTIPEYLLYGTTVIHEASSINTEYAQRQSTHDKGKSI